MISEATSFVSVDCWENQTPLVSLHITFNGIFLSVKIFLRALVPRECEEQKSLRSHGLQGLRGDQLVCAVGLILVVVDH
jgi:hypothetical protein